MLFDLPRAFYYCNSVFKKDVLHLELGIEAKDEDFVEMMGPWKRKAYTKWLKWHKLDELISVPESYFGEDRVTGKDVPGVWKAYLAGGTETPLKMIMEHYLSYILREAILLIRCQPSQSWPPRTFVL